MLRVFYELPFTEIMEINDKAKIHHLTVVLRTRVGDEVYLVADKKVAKTEVIEISKTNCIVKLIEEFDEDNEHSCDLTLGFGPLKGDNTQLVIQKAVELGVNHIDLINFKRNVSKFDSKKADKKIDKFNKIIEGACLQSRRNIKPTVAVSVDLTETYFSQFDLILVCYENERSNHLMKYAKKIKESDKILVLIGPEGGIDEQEIAIISAAANTEVATLGPRILRAETASISSLAMINAILEGN